MADAPYSHGFGGYEYDSDDRSRPILSGDVLPKLTNAAGALISVALLVGIGVWGYKLMVRDVSGIPVVRALEGEMRVRPDDPGGILAQHQGLAVNEVAADGAAAKPADRLVLAPRDVDLNAEDQPRSVEAPSPVASGVTKEAVTGPEQSTDLPNTIDTIVSELIGESADTQATIADPTPERVVAAPRMQRPPLRSADVPAILAERPVAPLSETREINPESIPSGTRLVQLGAFDSAEIARGEWERLSRRFEDYLIDKSRVIERAETGGRIFYRLRAMGFTDLADARRFCSAFKANNADCIPVVSK